MEEKNNWLMFTHLSAFTGCLFPLGNVIAPFILWQLKQNEIPEIVAHAKSAMNFQITVSILAFILAFIPIIGWIALFGVGLFAIIQIVIGSLKASKGELHQYPFALQLLQ